MTPEQLSNLRREFPVTEKYAYLDHSRLGPLPRSAVAAISASIEAHSRDGSPVFKAFRYLDCDKHRRQGLALAHR